MTMRNWPALLLGTAIAALASGASAQEATPESAPARAEDAAAQIELLQAQVDAMQAQIDDLKKKTASAAPGWKGAPEFKGENGFSFKLRGRLMYDIGYVENPGDAIATKNLGFNSRVRRARLGVEGGLPGGFAYKAEADFANNDVSWADLLLEYKPKDSPFSVRVGHFETFQSLEQMTSSRHIMFLERAQMNDAFGHGRRLGLGVGYDQGDLLLRAGLFNDSINGDFDNDEWLAGARAVYAPKMGDSQLHFGVNYQHREFSSTGLAYRYRARPLVQTTDVRFVNTGSVAADSDDVFGIEAAGIFGPLWLAAEGQLAKPNGYRPGRLLTGGDSAGTATVTAKDPTFKSFYVEAGYWLTGETRGYKKGEWDRTKVLNGFDKGGLGALALTARYDHLDLADGDLYTGFNNDFGTGTFTPATSLARGGKQTGYLLSLVWQPIDYVRVTTQYGRVQVEGGPSAAAVEPGSAAPINERDYGVDTLAMRFAFDF